MADNDERRQNSRLYMVKQAVKSLLFHGFCWMFLVKLLLSSTVLIIYQVSELIGLTASHLAPPTPTNMLSLGFGERQAALLLR